MFGKVFMEDKNGHVFFYFFFNALLSCDNDLSSGYFHITKIISWRLINYVFRNIKLINKHLITFHITLLN